MTELTEKDEETSRKFSPSRLGAYKNCPRQYKYRYIDRIRRDGRTVEAHLGTSVHTALELLYAGLQHGKRLSETEVLAEFEQAWKKDLDPAPVMHDDRYALGDWRNLGRECVASYYRRHQPFTKDKTISVEARMGFPLDLRASDGGLGPTVRIEGYIDRLALSPDGALEIHDYKTGKTLPTQADQDEDWQLAIYNIAVLQAWPDTKVVRLIWHYVRHGKTIVSSRTPEQLEALKDDIRSLVDTIRTDRVFEPVKSALCDWCDYRDICPLWKHAEAYAILPEEERKHESGVKLVDAYAALDHRKKVLKEEIAAIESEQDDLEKRIVDYAEKNELLSVTGTDAALDVRSREEFHFPTRTQAPEKIELIESKLKETPIWPSVSRLDARALMDGFKKKLWPQPVMRLIESWVDRLIKHEIVKTVRLHKKKESEEE